MLERMGQYNDLSAKLRKRLTERIKSYGDEVVYSFDISHPNPDPEKYNGGIVWPSIYTLDPLVFDVVDEDEEREDRSKIKKVGLILDVDKDGKIMDYRRVRVKGQEEGVFKLDLKNNPEDVATCAYLELHPKVAGSFFQDKRLVAVAKRVDEKQVSEDSRKKRHQRATALRIATELEESGVREFAAAMNWNENQPISILKDKVEEYAERYSELFNDLAKSDRLKYQATVKMALSKGIVVHDPVAGRFLWGANQEAITVLPPNGTQNPVEQFAEFLRTNGKKSDEVYKKIQSLLKS